jgi:hypothetical protein
MIDHRTTSANHPQADGLAERAVGTCKRALRKMVDQRGSAIDWAQELPWLMLGYNCSPQNSTGFAPYQLLFARTPTIPLAARQRFEGPLDFDTPEMREVAALRLLQRAELARRHAVIAGDNLRIAQHRDARRYELVRSGSHQPRLHRFMAGDYVYVQQRIEAALQLPAQPLILRVKEARSSGVLVLTGSDGRDTQVHLSRCAPCHLPNIDTRIDYSRAPVEPSLRCVVCQDSGNEAAMVICDACNEGWHLQCMVPPLEAVPPGLWVCPACTVKGIRPEDVEARAQAAVQQERNSIGRRPVVANPTLAAQDAEARALHGRLIKKQFHEPRTRRLKWYWGRLHFRGPTFRPNYFQVTYSDGDWEINSLPRLQRKGVVLQSPSARLPTSVVVPLAGDANPQREGPHQLGGESGLPAV